MDTSISIPQIHKFTILKVRLIILATQKTPPHFLSPFFDKPPERWLSGPSSSIALLLSTAV